MSNLVALLADAAVVHDHLLFEDVAAAAVHVVLLVVMATLF